MSTKLLALLALVFVGWMVEATLQPVLPLVILDRGGTATVVGLAAAAYSMPSLVLRPFVGQAIDRRGYSGIQRNGAIPLALAPLIYAAPSLVILMVGRVLQGTGWSLYSTANQVMMADLAPSRRRGEMSGYVSMMRAIAFLFGPPLGLWLFARSQNGAFIAAALVGVMAFVAASAWHRRVLHMQPASLWIASAARPGKRQLLEPTGIPSMSMVAMFNASLVLFVGFAPVFVREMELDVRTLSIFYPVYGIMLVLAPTLLARVSDRIGRHRSIGYGCSLAIIGLAVAIVPAGMVTFTVGALVVAASSSLVTPTIAAATMDRAPDGKLGSAMATYTMGYQLAGGVGGAMWGVVIETMGFSWTFLIAIGLQIFTYSIAVHTLRDGP